MWVVGRQRPLCKKTMLKCWTMSKLHWNWHWGCPSSPLTSEIRQPKSYTEEVADSLIGPRAWLVIGLKSYWVCKVRYFASLQEAAIITQLGPCTARSMYKTALEQTTVTSLDLLPSKGISETVGSLAILTPSQLTLWQLGPWQLR